MISRKEIQINMLVLKQCVMAATYLLWNQYCNSLPSGVSRTWNCPFIPGCTITHSFQGLTRPLASDLQTGASSSVNISTGTLRNRRLHTKPNLANSSVAWKFGEIQTTLQKSQIHIFAEFGWLIEQHKVAFSKTGNVFWHWSGLRHYTPLWLLAIGHSKICRRNQQTRTSLASLLCQTIISLVHRQMTSWFAEKLQSCYKTCYPSPFCSGSYSRSQLLTL